MERIPYGIYSKELREEAVKLITEDGLNIAEVRDGQGLSGNPQRVLSGLAAPRFIPPLSPSAAWSGKHHPGSCRQDPHGATMGCVKVSGFSHFSVKDKRARKGRNPQTGETMVLAVRKVLLFRLTNVLKDQINGREKY